MGLWNVTAASITHEKTFVRARLSCGCRGASLTVLDIIMFLMILAQGKKTKKEMLAMKTCVCWSEKQQ